MKIIKKTQADLYPGADWTQPTIIDFRFSEREAEDINSGTWIEYTPDLGNMMKGKLVNGSLKWEIPWFPW